ncbi:MAG: MBL fold metallo-hydrolase [Lachnospiraceae bacterium]|nr:MBL fold metallo-hydrolase [Lachnospiraceae bacterium]
MKLERYVVGIVETNCYFVINEDTGEMVCVDPGILGDKLAEAALRDGYKPVAVLLTHGHFDHVGGAEEFVNTSALNAGDGKQIPVCILDKDRETMADPEKNASWMIRRSREYRADHMLQDGQELILAGMNFKVIHTPGHTPGGCCYYLEQEGILFSGDTLFRSSRGRTDLPGGSEDQLLASIRDRLMPLPEQVKVLPGHGEATTIGEERRYY